MRSNKGNMYNEEQIGNNSKIKRLNSAKMNNQYNQQVFHDDYNGGDYEQVSRNTKYGSKKDIDHEVIKSGQMRGKGKKYQDEQEDELSSLSGFTASDNEEQEDMKFKMAPKGKKNKRDFSDDEEWEAENRDIVLNHQEDIKERFLRHENLRKKNEEERRQREILASQNPDNIQNVPLKRPHSSHGALKGSENNKNMGRTFMNTQKENLYQERPQTAYNASHDDEEYEIRQTPAFKPIYTKTIQQTLIEKKVFNYTDKKFKTIAKKSDPVSRFNAFRNEWNKTKFLKANPKMKEGRKLNLAERNQNSKPDFIFHRYQPKYTFD